MQSQHKYFPVNDTQKAWGLYTTCVGHTTSAPGAEFPSRAHPDEYYFSWAVGRVLHEWQIIYIEQGKGTVEFKRRRFKVGEGSFIAIPPGCWHRYRPNKKTGWTTLWIGFGGDLAARLVGGAGFNTSGEVRDLYSTHRFHDLFLETVSDILEKGHDSVFAAAARIPMLIAALIEHPARGESRPPNIELVHKAQMHINEHAAETVDFEALANSLCVTYRSFRYLFTKATGMSPLQYQLNIRLARAMNLLKSSDMTIMEITKTLGFNSTWYFSHFFRRQTGLSAAAYRRRHELTMPTP